MVNMHKNTWHPDTCDCVVEYEWDRDLTPETRIHKYKNTIKTCPMHLGLTSTSLYDTLMDENPRKNKMLALMKEELPDIKENYIEPSTGEPKTRIKWGISFEWNFTGQDDNRILHMEIKGRVLTTAEKTKIKDRSNKDFGIGKVDLL